MPDAMLQTGHERTRHRLVSAFPWGLGGVTDNAEMIATTTARDQGSGGKQGALDGASGSTVQRR